MPKPLKQCIAENDFLAALENLHRTTSHWMSHWFQGCLQIMENDPNWKARFVPDYEYLDFSPVTADNIDFHQVWYHNGKEILVNGDIDLLDEVEQKCYLFRFFDSNNQLVCSKVGTTTKPILIRIKSELREYAKLDVCTCVIDRIYDCGELPAEGMESYFRAEYIRKHPQAFKKNDRFVSVAFDLIEADHICRSYLSR